MEGVEQIKEECRDMRRINFIQDLAGDIRYGLRQMATSKGFTLVVAASLTLGIDADRLGGRTGCCHGGYAGDPQPALWAFAARSVRSGWLALLCCWSRLPC